MFVVKLRHDTFSFTTVGCEVTYAIRCLRCETEEWFWKLETGKLCKRTPWSEALINPNG